MDVIFFYKDSSFEVNMCEKMLSRFYGNVEKKSRFISYKSIGSFSDGWKFISVR